MFSFIIIIMLISDRPKDCHRLDMYVRLQAFQEMIPSTVSTNID